MLPRFLALVATAVAVPALAVACAPVPAGEGELVLYSGRSESLMQPLIDAFETQSGIEVEVRYGNTPEMAALLLEEGQNSRAEVFLSQDAGALGALSDAGLFAPLPDGLGATVPDGLTSTDGSWLGVTGRARVIVYDGQLLDGVDVPTSVDALTEPEWRGRFGIAPGNASFQAFVTAYRVLKGEHAAERWVAGIVANDPQIFDNNAAILTAVNDGVLDVGLINHYYWFRLAAEIGADAMRAQLGFPEVGDPGSIVNVTGAGILARGTVDGDAEAFLEYLVSPEGQAYFVDEVHEYPLVPGVAAPEGLPTLESLVTSDFDLSDLASLARTQEMLAEYGLV